MPDALPHSSKEKQTVSFKETAVPSYQGEGYRQDLLPQKNTVRVPKAKKKKNFAVPNNAFCHGEKKHTLFPQTDDLRTGATVGVGVTFATC